MIPRGIGSGIIFNWTMTVDPEYECIKEVHVGKIWYTMESKHFISNMKYIFENENGNIVPFNYQSITFRISIEET